MVSEGDPSCLWASVCTSGPWTAVRETAEDNDVWTWGAGEEAFLGQEMKEGIKVAVVSWGLKEVHVGALRGQRPGGCPGWGLGEGGDGPGS